MNDRIRDLNWPLVLQLLLVAAISALASGYVSGKVVEAKMDYVIQELRRIDGEGRDTRAKLDGVAMKQAGAISQAGTIHEAQNHRIDRLEGRR